MAGACIIPKSERLKNPIAMRDKKKTRARVIVNFLHTGFWQLHSLGGGDALEVTEARNDAVLRGVSWAFALVACAGVRACAYAWEINDQNHTNVCGSFVECYADTCKVPRKVERSTTPATKTRIGQRPGKWRGVREWKKAGAGACATSLTWSGVDRDAKCFATHASISSANFGLLSTSFLRND